MRRAGQKAIQGCLPISLDTARLIELDPLDERVEKIAAARSPSPRSRQGGRGGMSVTPIPSRNASRLATPLRTSPVQAARTPREWLAVLEERLRKQQDEVDVYERYFVGDHPLRFATTKFKEVFGNLFGAFSDNWNELIVLASVERLEVTGFRTGVNDEGDAAIWRRWQENNLDNGSVLAHTEAVKTGRAYVIVNSDGRMAVEHPAQVVVAHMPGDRRQRLAA
jgi:hypothetical protein